MRVIDLLIYGIVDFILFYVLLYRPLQKRKKRIEQSFADLNKKNHELMEINNRRIVSENSLIDFSAITDFTISGSRFIQLDKVLGPMYFWGSVTTCIPEEDTKIQKSFKADLYSELVYNISQYIIKMKEQNGKSE